MLFDNQNVRIAGLLKHKNDQVVPDTIQFHVQEPILEMIHDIPWLLWSLSILKQLVNNDYENLDFCDMQLCFHKGLDSTNLPCFMGHWYPTISDIGSKCPFFAILGRLIGCLISVNGPYISLENLWEEKAGEIHQGLIRGIPAMTCQRQFQLLKPN